MMENISLNFGAIRDTVYRLSAKELISESKEDKSLKKFVKALKDEPVLRVQYMVFENLQKGHFENERLAERYINENMRLVKNVDWNHLLETNKKVRKSILDEHFVGATNGEDKLYDAIHSLIESRTNKGFKNINKSHEAYEVVLEHLQREVVKEVREQEEKEDMPNFFSWKYINEHAVSNFNKRYKHLNESDQELLKVLLSSEDVKINYANDLKNESLERIEYLLEDESELSDLLEGFKNKLNKLQDVNSKNVDDIIINCKELEKTLSQLS
jgi:hypothetical protein